MTKDSGFKLALLVSIVAHSALFWQLPRFDILPSKRALNKLEVTYYRIKDRPKTPPPSQFLVKNPIIKENLLKNKQIPKNNTLDAQKKATVIKTVKAEEKPSAKIMVKKKKGEENKKWDKLSKDPVYLTYTQTLHQKIRQVTLKNCPKNFTDGAVFVSFTISSKGELEEVIIVEDKSNAQAILKEVARGSVQEAAPFPEFPKSFNQAKITFNVIISFETEK